MDDDGRCEVCAMWRDLANHKSDGGKQLLVEASDGCSDSLVRASHPFPPALIQFLLSHHRFLPVLLLGKALGFFWGVRNLTEKLLPETARDAASDQPLLD
jgi:hypothetical protein